MNIKEEIESVLLNYMDNTYRGFESGYFVYSTRPTAMRDQLIELFIKTEKENRELKLLLAKIYDSGEGFKEHDEIGRLLNGI